jgi:membrane protease YdiL (CAAX protease family)
LFRYPLILDSLWPMPSSSSAGDCWRRRVGKVNLANVIPPPRFLFFVLIAVVIVQILNVRERKCRLSHEKEAEMSTAMTGSKNLGQMKGSQSSSFVKRHALTAYFVLTLGITWLIALPMIASAQGLIDASIPFALHYLTAYGPLAAAFIVTAMTDGTAGIRELWGRMFQWRVGLGWILVSAFSLVALFGVAAVSLRLLGEPWPDLRLLGQVNYLPNLGIGAWLLWILTSGFGEETGWRGFALPRLQKHHNALMATLILTVFWVLWHVPFFFYLDTYVKLGFAMFPIFALSILAGAIIFTWLYNSTGGSVLMAVLWHGALNFVTASAAGEGTIAVIMSVAIMVWALLVVIVYKPANLSHRQRHVL